MQHAILFSRPILRASHAHSRRSLRGNERDVDTVADEGTFVENSASLREVTGSNGIEQTRGKLRSHSSSCLRCLWLAGWLRQLRVTWRLAVTRCCSLTRTRERSTNSSHH